MEEVIVNEIDADIDAPENRIYEIGYLMVPSIEEKDVAMEVGNLKAVIDAKGATTIAEEFPKLITLAYEMTKVINNKNVHFNTGYFGWIKFEASPSMAESLGEELKRYTKLIRFLLIKTVRENTLAGKRPFGTRGSGSVRKYEHKKESEAVTPMDKEEIDREIDALVADEPAEVKVEDVVVPKEESIL